MVWRAGFEIGDEDFGMHAQDRLAGSQRGDLAGQGLERFVLQHALDGAQPVRAFGMALAHFVAQRDGVGDEKRFQGGVLQTVETVWPCRAALSMGHASQTIMFRFTRV